MDSASIVRTALIVRIADGATTFSAVRFSAMLKIVSSVQIARLVLGETKYGCMATLEPLVISICAENAYTKIVN